MTDREAPGPPEAGKRTVRDQLRRKLDELKPARNDPARGAEEPSTVVRLPRQPRRVVEEPAGRRDKPWRDNAPGDPPPTRPVLRSELQAETGAWQAEADGPVGSAPEPGAAERGGELVELHAWQRKRASGKPPAPRRIRPRRIDRNAGDRGGADRDGDA
ncbi:hypothetical protein CJ469_04399 [Nocardia farcinica]|uniref:hypothetical protein n=1 Tax=Nocardia farcinica TaxID=37329 RepID=UPI000BF82851|nr:hypothetical protein [Nocardia farcinica]PFX00577.1 hypothetical protein CJ469_04399 [Nocardia farcinica]PFX08130.1 hypothetical protein CJ468_03014 [Nocardia farcinica]